MLSIGGRRNPSMMKLWTKAAESHLCPLREVTEQRDYYQMATWKPSKSITTTIERLWISTSAALPSTVAPTISRTATHASYLPLSGDQDPLLQDLVSRDQKQIDCFVFFFFSFLPFLLLLHSFFFFLFTKKIVNMLHSWMLPLGKLLFHRELVFLFYLGTFFLLGPAIQGGSAATQSTCRAAPHTSGSVTTAPHHCVEPQDTVAATITCST